MSGVERGPWRGRVDAEDGTAGERWHQRVAFSPPATEGVALLGLASDLGVIRNKGRPGAAAGPAALRAALANQAWHLPLDLYDAGDVAPRDDLDRAQLAYAAHMAALLEAGHFVLGLGGGHEIGWASYLGCRQFLNRCAGSHDGGPKSLGIINFDAHFDLRTPSPDSSSGTPFYQVSRHCAEQGQIFHYACLGVSRTSNTRALFDRANALGVDYLLDVDFEGERVQSLLSDFLARVDSLYLSVCLDVLPADRAPGVSAPAALGVAPALVIAAIGRVGCLCREYGVQWLACDLAELSPPHDLEDRTARLGARLADELLWARFGTGTGHG